MLSLIRLRWLDSVLVILVVCAAPGVARAQLYCPVNAFFDPAMPGTVYASPPAGVSDSVDVCSMLGGPCPLAVGSGRCRQLGDGPMTLRCVPDVAGYPLFWSCDSGCECPTFAGTTPSVRNLSLSGGLCFCQYETDGSYCEGGSPSPESFASCHTAPGAAAMPRVLVEWAAGDCDDDGVPNSCEPTTGCMPCTPPIAPTGACATARFMPSAMCMAGDGGTPVDAGSASDAGGVDADVPRRDASVVDEMDAGTDVPPSVEYLAFRGGGGVACGVAAAGSRPSHEPPLAAFLVAFGALVATRSSRRRRR